MRHGESFHTAFAAFMQQVGNGQDRRTYERVMTADSPGEEIVKWHREQDLFQRTGGDLSAFEQKLREQILAELQGQQQDGGQPQPSPRQQAVQDAPRAPNGQFAPRHEVRLPTPTSRLPGSAGVHGNADVEDGSDDAIFGSARRRPRNRE